MAKKSRHNGKDDRWAVLRALRLAEETERKAAGTWGEMAVGEILHDAAREVFVLVWKGQRRPDPFLGGARSTGTPPEQWLAVVAWITAHRSAGFSERTVAWNLSAAEARKVWQSRMAEHHAAGYTVINPDEAGH